MLDVPMGLMVYAVAVDLDADSVLELIIIVSVLVVAGAWGISRSLANKRHDREK